MLIPVVAFFAVTFAVVVVGLWLAEEAERLTGHPVLQRVADWLGEDEPAWAEDLDERLRRAGR